MGNTAFCWTSALRQTTTSKPSEMVVMGSADKVQDSSWSVINFHPVSHSAMSAGFVILVLLLLMCMWYCCRSFATSAIKKFKDMAFGRATPDLLRQARDLEMAKLSTTGASASTVWDLTKRGAPMAPPLPPSNFGMPPPSSGPWNQSIPSLTATSASEGREVMEKLDSLLDESRETQRNLYRTLAKVEAQK